MKHLKLFFALFAMLALGVGNAWGAGTWTLVKDVSTLAAGDKVIIVAKDNNFAMSTTQNTNNRGQVTVTKDGETLTYTTEVQELTLKDGNTSGTLAFYTGSGYLYAASSNRNYLKTETTLSANSSWTITIANTGVATIKATGSNSRNWLRYNSSNNPPIFSCYESGQGDVCLYKYVEEQGETGTLSCTWDLSTNSYSDATTEQVTWSSTYVNMIVEKGKVGTAANDYLGGVNGHTSSRFYQNSILKIRHRYDVTITSVVFTAKTEADATALLNSDWSNAADATASGIIVTVTPNDPEVDLSAPIGETCEFIGVTVYYTKGDPEPEPEKTATSLVWSQTEYAVTMGETPTFPTLTTTPADLTGVTYSSSNGAVATIAEDGTITIKAAGETTIKASYAGNETYAAATDATYKLTVNKAPATPTENVYVKVTTTAGITDGEYLIVYEDAASGTPAPVAFDGSLETLDAVSNNIAVTISNNTIAGNTDIDAAIFTIDATAGTIKSASGYYIGQTSDANGLKANSSTEYTNTLSIKDDGTAIVKSGGAYLRYNSDATNWRFRYFKSSSYTGQKAIALYKKASKHTVTIACTNGSVSAKMGETALATNDQVLSGTQITLSNTPATGYKLAAYEVYKTDDATTKVTVTNGKFIMPEFDVTISATFEVAKTLKSIEITNAATQTIFWQTETFNHNGLKVTAHFDGAEDEGEDVTDKVTVTGSTETAGEQTVTVSFTEGTTKTTTYTINVKAIPNTKETAYDVATAREIIDKVSTADNVYVTGIVSEIVTAYNEQYGNISYNISVDGTKTADQLQAFRGKSYNGENFTSADDIQVGDEVVIKGTLKKYSTAYSTIYEFDENNQLVSLNRTKQQAGLAYAETEYTANVDEDFAEPTLINPNELSVEYSTSDATLATVNATTGEVTIGNKAGKVTITASFAGNETYLAGSASYTIKVMGIASLPFAFDGKCADIATTAGMTQEGLGDDYKSDPKLRFDNTGDWVIIHFNSQPGEFSFLLKQNGSNAGTFTVYESANGEDYTSVWSGGDFGNTQSKTIKPTLSATARYVKFEYTTKGNSTNYALGSISIAKPDTREEAGLAWDPSSVTLTQGDAFTAPTLKNPNSVSGITYETNNDAVATVTTEGVIALASATGTATITATFEGDATYKPATATCTITVNEYIETIDGEWELVTDASKLQAGMEVIVAQYVEADGTIYTMGAQNTSNRASVESRVSGTTLTPTTGTVVLTLADAGNGTFALQAGNGNFLYAASSSANHLKEMDEIDVNGQWTITIADSKATIKAEGSSNRNLMCYNSSSKLFSCYASNNPQQAIALYAKKPAHTRTTSAGRYGTICLPGNIVKCLGATLYEVAGREGDKVIFDEVTTPDAGMPYIFLAHNAEVLFYCGDQTAAAGHHKSLYGTFTELQNSELEGMYMVQNNKIVKCNPANSGVAKNRAYFKGSELDALGKPGAQMPGRRRITMGTEGENEATGTEDVVAPAGQTLKLIENDQLIIIRNGEKFNAQGMRL